MGQTFSSLVLVFPANFSPGLQLPASNVDDRLTVSGMSRTLIVIGIVIVLIGVSWPWLGRLGLGRLQGDIIIERGNVKLYFPITTCVLISVVISLILWAANR